MIKEDKRSYYPRVGYKDYVIDAIELIFGLFLLVRHRM